MTTLLAKANSFLGHAYSILLRYVPKAQPKPSFLFLCFGGLVFTSEPLSGNLQTKLLKSRSRQQSRLFSFWSLTPTRIIKSIILQKEDSVHSSAT